MNPSVQVSLDLAALCGNSPIVYPTSHLSPFKKLVITLLLGLSRGRIHLVLEPEHKPFEAFAKV